MPRFPPNPSGTAPLYPVDELHKLQAIMDRRSAQPPPHTHVRRSPWLVRGLVLVAVAIVSGLVWWLVQPGGGSESASPTTSASAGKFSFQADTQVPEPLKDSDCAPHAYGETKNFLTKTPCQQLTRALYTTAMPDGRTVYTSVSVVRMKSAEEAVQLKALTERNGTGNVNDLVKEKIVAIPGLDTLANGGYAAEQRDREVVIVESDSVKKAADKAMHSAEMKRISADALRLASSLG
ncbi:hypothetical protein FKR81_20855 [Lentzea tibetensis]|uniref:Uncharacterized protein n=1 Tax=Lentzea tibetensis TaxID=2591470 RepID=A0A563ER80_9PSEU|nr:hypothetical protein [Lentzea tibetensis]TWP50169.1 hypothetical protein FKR81_20855 [Lentzea tibetensis]